MAYYNNLFDVNKLNRTDVKDSGIFEFSTYNATGVGICRKIKSNTHVFIANHNKYMPQIEMYEIEKNGLETFIGYAGGDVFCRLNELFARIWDLEI